MALRRSTRSVRQLSTTIVQNGDLNILKSTEFTPEASRRRSSSRKGKPKEQPAKSRVVHTCETIDTSEDVGEAVSIRSRRKTNKIKEELKWMNSSLSLDVSLKNVGYGRLGWEVYSKAKEL